MHRPPNKPIKTRQQIANEANAKLSTGPRTPEGKAASSMNALKHGLYAFEYILSSEDESDMNLLRESYWNRFQPADPVEASIVDQMISARWRVHRAVIAETNAIQTILLDDFGQPPSITEGHPAAFTGRAYARVNPNLMALITRQISAYTREHSRLLKDLMLVRAMPPAAIQPPAQPVEPVEPVQPEPQPEPQPAPENSPVRNEPIPVSGHPSSRRIFHQTLELSPPVKIKTAAA